MTTTQTENEILKHMVHQIKMMCHNNAAKDDDVFESLRQAFVYAKGIVVGDSSSAVPITHGDDTTTTTTTTVSIAGQSGSRKRKNPSDQSGKKPRKEIPPEKRCKAIAKRSNKQCTRAFTDEDTQYCKTHLDQSQKVDKKQDKVKDTRDDDYPKCEHIDKEGKRCHRHVKNYSTKRCQGHLNKQKNTNVDQSGQGSGSEYSSDSESEMDDTPNKKHKPHQDEEMDFADVNDGILEDVLQKPKRKSDF